MVVWILILIPWVALLSLILHDATKEDSNGSAILITAKNLNALIVWARKKSVSKPPAKFVTGIKAVSLAAKRTLRGEIKQAPAAPAKKQWWSRECPVSSEPGVAREIKQASAPPRKKQWWRKERRASMSIQEHERAILEAVKATPGCEDFVGVIVAHQTPKSHRDPNWLIRGVKFGKTDRKVANEALDRVVERMQREYRLSVD